MYSLLFSSLLFRNYSLENKHGWQQEKNPQGYVRDSRPIKRSVLSRLSIRNHLSPATSFAQWLMGLHRPWVPAHYLVHTAPLLKYKGRNMKHCFRRCLRVKKKNLFIVGLEKKASWPFLVMWTHDKTLAVILVQISPKNTFKSNQLRLKDWLLRQMWRYTRQNGDIVVN